MKTVAFALLCAALATAAFPLSSALSAAPAPQEEVPEALNRGRVITGFSVLPGSLPVLKGVSKSTPVTIRAVSGKWVEIDYPGQVGGPVWINTDLVVSFRVER